MPKPASWADLGNPGLQGLDRDAEPGLVGHRLPGGLCAGSRSWARRPAWEFMDKLHQNVAVYTHSGSAPCVQAAKGERVIGIGFDMRGAKEKTERRADRHHPGQGRRAAGTWKPRRSSRAPRTWPPRRSSRTSPSASRRYELYGKYYAIVGYPGHEPGAAELSAERRRGDGQDRPRQDGRRIARTILAEWTKRYDSQVGAEVTRTQPEREPDAALAFAVARRGPLSLP